jgi:hypothetical protein
VRRATALEWPARMRNRPYSLLARFYDRLVPGVAEMNRCARRRVLGRELARAGFGRIRTFDGAGVRPRKMKTPRGTDLYFRARKRA